MRFHCFTLILATTIVGCGDVADPVLSSAGETSSTGGTSSTGETPSTGGAVQISLSTKVLCARFANGEVRCHSSAVPLSDGAARLGAVVDIRVGGGFVVVLKDDGSVWTWGYNHENQLGRGCEDDIGWFSAEPKRVPTSASVVSIAAGSGHACAVLVDGTAVCWGRYWDGQLGNGLADDYCWRSGPSEHPQMIECASGATGADLYACRPAPVTSFASGIGLALGTDHSCGRRKSGTVDCWGRVYALGVGVLPAEFRPAAGPVPDVEHVDAIWALPRGTIARRSDGSTLSWGLRDWGPVPTDAQTPTPIPALDDIDAVAATYDHACTLRGGRVSCWDQALDATVADLEPKLVEGLDDVVQIVTAVGATCALRSKGTTLCWGPDLVGILGHAGVTASAAPVEVLW